MYIPKTYNAVSFIALLVQFNAAHDFTLAEINKKQEISVLVCLYAILKFSIYLLFSLKELFPLVNIKDNWYEMLFIDTWNESAKRARVVGRGRGRNKQTSAQTETVSVISAPSMLQVINTVVYYCTSISSTIYTQTLCSYH